MVTGDGESERGSVRVGGGVWEHECEDARERAGEAVMGKVRGA
eukprot:CAMPEP_0181317598 /NCGR_PEP_ID=MMETSP1101-20121128/16557_1 /TAXON_ID=46948 /ORGANISM="Rhodomonas abbreviata, Strain Caron Lab Isolate" /LENGTH=42 /DNA_ID= /DNA_START= /DNA_END= /DNA_ORIENTATION=